MSYPYLAKFFIDGRSIPDILIFINIAVIDVFLIAIYYRMLIRIFRKTILRKKFVVVEKPYTEEVEISTPSRRSLKQ